MLREIACQRWVRGGTAQEALQVFPGEPLPSRNGTKMRHGSAADRDDEARTALGLAQDLTASVAQISLGDRRHERSVAQVLRLACPSDRGRICVSEHPRVEAKV